MKYLTINTQMGLFQYNRLMFGIISTCYLTAHHWSSAERNIWPGYILNDLIITGKDDEEHLANLEEILRRLQLHRLRAINAKYWEDNLLWTWHWKDGLHKAAEKEEAV